MALAKPKQWCEGRHVGFCYSVESIAAEREAWRKEVAVWKKSAADFEGALDDLNDRYQQLSLNYDMRVEDNSKLQAALDKVETKYAASSTAADELLDNWKHRADKAERTLSEKVSAAEARIKELEEGVHEIAEEVLGCSAPCSLDVRAKCKELEAKAGISQDASQRLKK